MNPSVFATEAYMHVDGRELPRALADLHRSLTADAPISLSFFGSGSAATDASANSTSFKHDSLPGRRVLGWRPDDLTDLLEGAGFETEIAIETGRDGRVPHLRATGHRRRTLPDTVGPDMALLVCGLNPSMHAADAGIGFVTPGNRFWPAALAAGIVTQDRDPWHALDAHGMGMTDLVKRATRRADELETDDYNHGMARVERLARWLSPGAVCFVGLAGYRLVVDRRATAGPQPESIGGRPVYLMPSTSGLNAHSQLGDLTDHLRRAQELATR